MIHYLKNTDNKMNTFELIVRKAWVWLIFALPVVAVAQSASRPDIAQVEDYIKHSALVGFEWVDQPLSRILLLRNSRTTCLIRFISYHRANDSRPPTSFNTGEASQFAVYEVAQLTVHRSGIVVGPTIRKELSYRGLRGLGRLAFDVGDSDIRCGRERYSWLFPTGLLLKEEQNDVLIAPTNWQSFNDVRLNNPKLRWYQRDQQMQRSIIIIPMEDLPY